MIRNGIRYILTAMAALATVSGANAQEFRATVEVNTQKIEGTNKSVFDNLKGTFNPYGLHQARI